MKAFISVFEASAEQNALYLIKACQASKLPIEWVGYCGAILQESGVRSLMDTSHLGTMGYVEVIRDLSKWLHRLNQSVRDIDLERPDVLILVDFSGFHLRLLQRLNFRPNKIIYLIPPKVWVHGRSRVAKIRTLVDEVWVPYSFESEFYENGGVPVREIPSPIIQSLLPGREISRAEAEKKLVSKKAVPANWMSDHRPIIAVMPGSRFGEIEAHLPVLMNAISQPQAQSFRFLWILTRVVHSRVNQLLRSRGLDFNQHAVVDIDLRVLALRASRFGWIKSGTSTLEALILGLNHLVFYKAPFLRIIQKLIGYYGAAGLSNCILRGPQTKPVRFLELLQEDFTAPAIWSETSRSIEDPSFDEIDEEWSGFLKKQAIDVAAVNWGEYLTPGSRVTEFLPSDDSSIKFSVNRVYNGVHQFRKRYAQPKRLTGFSGRIISIGNIEFGGTGKTPMLLDALQRALAAGLKPCVLSRGYGGQMESASTILSADSLPGKKDFLSDETALLRRIHPNVPVGIGRDRYAVACDLLEKYPDRNLVILDDGHQNLTLTADERVVLLTSNDERKGWFRELPKYCSQSDMLIWTKGRYHPPVSTKIISGEIIFQTILPEIKDVNKLLVLTTLANPVPFWLSLSQKYGDQLELIKYQLRDHALISKSDFDRIRRTALRENAVIVMTKKECIKWANHVDGASDFGADEPRVVVADLSIEWIRGESKWQHLCSIR